MFNTMFANIPKGLGVLITDAEYNLVFASGMAKSLIERGQLSEMALSMLKKAIVAKNITYNTEAHYCLIESRIVEYSNETYYILWIKDESELKEAKETLNFCLDILDNINEGVIASDCEGNIIIYNKKLAELEDMKKDDVIGKQLKDVYHEWSAEKSEHCQVLKTGESIKERSYKNITKEGKSNQLVASSFPILVDGKTVAAYSVSRDVTTIKEIYERTIGLQSKNKSRVEGLKNGTRFLLEDIVHKSSAMDKLISDAKKAALGHSSVLVYGETGTGKEILVQGIHNYSSRRKEPFVALNCAALPETLLESLLFGTKKGAFTGAENLAGFFEQAGEGTLYLDEINSMPTNLQTRFLRTIQEKCYRRVGDFVERPIKCKIISSVNVDPIKCVEDGQLRQDLYYRLSTIVLEIPPLRKRKEDIVGLMEYFISKYCSIYGERSSVIDSDLKRAFQLYDWPGNVRELEHLIERGISMLDSNETLTLYNMPSYLREKLYGDKYMQHDGIREMSLNEILRIVEKKAVTEALEKNNMNISKAAKSLGIGRQNMQYRIDKLELKELLKNKGEKV